MKISLENATPDFSRAVNGIPPINTQRALTQVLVNDGADDGHRRHLRQHRSRHAATARPASARCRCSAGCSSATRISDESRELLIFITPRIIKS